MSRQKATILCIEDHWKELIARQRLLEQGGYGVRVANGWEEGLRLFLSHTVHAVVLDYQMPGMSGDSVAAMMKRLKPHIPVVLLSAYGPLPEKKLRSVDMFLCKSEAPARLLSTLHDLLEGKSKLFFYRWLDHWKSRNQVVRQ
jgi:CheY-like chemotaxis protein